MKLVCNNNNNRNIIDGILEKHGYTKEELLNPSSKYKTGYYNMEKAANRIIKAIKEEEIIGILVDDDCDGFTSSAVMKSYLHKLGKEIIPFFHEEKQHGLNDSLVDEIKDKGVSLLIIPDASSSDVFLEKMGGLDIVILDHHLFDKEVPENVIRVNNQSPKNTDSNTNLTGVGMVYRAIQIMDELLGVNYSNDDIDLVAIGQIADSSDYSEQEVRWIVNKGLSTLHNKLILTMLSERLGRGEEVAGRDLSFEVIPYINAVTRVGSVEEKRKLLNALCQEKEYDAYVEVEKKKKSPYTNRYSTVKVSMNGYEVFFEELKKIKKKQAKLVENFLKTNQQNIYSDGGVVIVQGSAEAAKGLSGLIAAKISNEYGKPVILITPHYNGEDAYYSGSIRGRSDILDSLKNWCEGTGLFDWVQGHDNAAGCQMEMKNLTDLVDKSMSVKSLEEIEVDYIGSSISGRCIREIYKNRALFGGKVNYPKVGITKIFKKEDIVSRGNSVLIFKDNKEKMEYIMFNATSDIKEQIENHGYFVTVKIYGEPNINHWGAKSTAQIIINRIEIDEDFDF